MTSNVSPEAMFTYIPGQEGSHTHVVSSSKAMQGPQASFHSETYDDWQHPALKHKTNADATRPNWARKVREINEGSFLGVLGTVHHPLSITLGGTPLIYHPRCITPCPECITLTASLSLHHPLCITHSTSPSVHHPQCITLGASPLVSLSLSDFWCGFKATEVFQEVLADLKITNVQHSRAVESEVKLIADAVFYCKFQPISNGFL